MACYPTRVFYPNGDMEIFLKRATSSVIVIKDEPTEHVLQPIPAHVRCPTPPLVLPEPDVIMFSPKSPVWRDMWANLDTDDNDPDFKLDE